MTFGATEKDSDLSGLRQILLKPSHERRVDKQASKKSVDALILLTLEADESLAYCGCEISKPRAIWLIKWREKTKLVPGLNPAGCSTPDRQKGLMRWRLCRLSQRLIGYDLSQANVVLFTPKLVESRESKVEWLMVSNEVRREELVDSSRQSWKCSKNSLRVMRLVGSGEQEQVTGSWMKNTDNQY